MEHKPWNGSLQKEPELPACRENGADVYFIYPHVLNKQLTSESRLALFDAHVK